MRGLCSTMLTLQAIVLGLSTPVLITVQQVDRSLAMGIGLGLGVACLVAVAFLRYPVGYLAGHLIQVATLAMGFVLPVMFGIGAMFAALWFGAFFLGRKIEADKARWAAEGDGPA